MQLLDSQYCLSQVIIPLINNLVELYLEVDTVLLLHVYNEIDTGDKHEGEKDSEDYIKIEIQHSRAT